MRQLIIFIALIALSYASSQKLVTYLNRITQYWPLQPLFADLAIPSYAPDNAYNVYIYTFWLDSGPTDTALIYSNPLTFFSTQNPFGTTQKEIQDAIINLFHINKKLLLVSAFGASENPTSSGKDATTVCTNLAQFVLINGFDGVDVDWEDNDAMESGKGEDWLITCTKVLRQYLPKGKYILTHAPQAPYFTGKLNYENGGYQKVHQEVGDLIDWYNIQFYNQGFETTYDTYQKLFKEAGGNWNHSAVQEIINFGIPPNQIVLGKPCGPGDATNTGYVNPSDLGTWAAQAQADVGWNTGLMTWQYATDLQMNFQFVNDFVNAKDNYKFFEEYKGVFDRANSRHHNKHHHNHHNPHDEQDTNSEQI